MVALFAILVGVAAFAYYYHMYQQIVDDRLAAGPLFRLRRPDLRRARRSPRRPAPHHLLHRQRPATPPATTSTRRWAPTTCAKTPSSSSPARSLTSPPMAPPSQPRTARSPPSRPKTESPSRATSSSPSSSPPSPKTRTAPSADSSPSTKSPRRWSRRSPRSRDRRFFEHGGVNYLRTAKCAYQDFMSHEKECGGSTITQQLARGFFLSPEKKYSRKLREIMITFQLENRFSKQQIFEMYANQINLGQRGSFAINGFGEAAQAFFGKDLSRLDTAEFALLAGTIQSPNRLNPYRHADRATERRNVVLDSMVETGAITEDEAIRAKAEPLHLAPANRRRKRSPLFRRSSARTARTKARRQPQFTVITHLHFARSGTPARRV